ncbi:MAG: recombinase family protein [Hyphomicrobium sp.]|nr:recombinase family protein [Hyphomicrobium sp.]
MTKRRKKTAPALAYLRTSSATNIGADKDSEKRQRAAIEAFAKRAGFEIIDWYYDEAISGADHLEDRPGFTDLLKRLKGNGVKTIIVETANRFARDLIVQELGFHALRELGCDLIAADSPNSFLEDTPTAILIRQVLGAVSQFEKGSLVAKLKGARDRKRRETGKCEGRKSHAEKRPGAVALAKKLHSASPKTGKRLSLRKISAALAEAGHLNERGQPFNQRSIKVMVEG